MYEKYFLKRYVKNHKIYIYIYIYIFNKIEEKKISEEELIPLLDFKKKSWDLHCFYSIHD